MRNYTNQASKSVALVTGAAGTLGLAISQKLAFRGYYVLLTDKDPERLRKIPPFRGIHRCESLDVTSKEHWLRIRSTIESEFGHLDCLVNCAGILEAGEIADLSWEQHKQVIDVNLGGTLLGCQIMSHLLCRRDRKTHLINIASYVGFVSPPWSASYNAAKAGIIALSETLHAELHARNVQVSVVCPGFFSSGLFAGDPDHSAPSEGREDPTIIASVKRMVDRSPLTADQVAQSVIDLLDHPCFYVVLPNEAKWAWRLKRWLPNWFLRRVATRADLLRARMRSKQKSDAAES